MSQHELQTKSPIRRNPANGEGLGFSSQRNNQIQLRHILQQPTIQTKLTVGAPDDKYEQEADKVADAVMRMPDDSGSSAMSTSQAPQSIQRACPECEEEQAMG